MGDNPFNINLLQLPNTFDLLNTPTSELFQVPTWDNPYTDKLKPNYSKAFSDYNLTPPYIQPSDFMQENKRYLESWDKSLEDSLQTKITISDKDRTSIDNFIENNKKSKLNPNDELEKKAKRKAKRDKIISYASSGLDAVNSILPGTINEKTAGYDAGFDAVADKAPGFWGLGMKAAGAVTDVTRAMGIGTDGVTGKDQFFDSKWFGGMYGLLGTRTSNMLNFNENTKANIGSGYQGLFSNIDNTLRYSNKKFGVASYSDLNRYNSQINDLNYKAGLADSISDTALLRRDLASSYDINEYRNLFNANGGLKANYMSVGRNGMKLNKSYPYTEEEIRLYVVDRFPILKNVSYGLLFDDNFRPEGFGNIEYMNSEHDELGYYNNYKKKNKGKSTIVFNSDVSLEDIALDVLSHGLREQDPVWKSILKELSQDPNWRNASEGDLFLNFLKEENIEKNPTWESLEEKWSDDKWNKYLSEFYKSELFDSGIDGIVRTLLTTDEHRRKANYDTDEFRLSKYKKSPTWLKALKYLNGNIEELKLGGTILKPISILIPIEEDEIEEFKKGGSINIIPDGALHAHKHHMETEGITKKGVPVVDYNGKQQAEIEREEIIYRLEVTEKLEKLSKIYYDEDSTNKEKEEAALKAGEILVLETLYNTIDNTKKLL